MAQTKRKRQTKHRGNAAGMVETRGRTSKPLSASDKKQADRAQARETRLNKKPTWKGAFQKAGLAGALMFAFLLFVNHNKKGATVLTDLIPALLAVCLYVPASYYLEIYMWRKRTGQAQGGLFGRARKG